LAEPRAIGRGTAEHARKKKKEGRRTGESKRPGSTLAFAMKQKEAKKKE
jgi:hypothetical protein